MIFSQVDTILKLPPESEWTEATKLKREPLIKNKCDWSKYLVCLNL